MRTITRIFVPAVAIALAAVFSVNAAEEAKSMSADAARVDKTESTPVRTPVARHDHGAFHKSGSPTMSRGSESRAKERAAAPKKEEAEATPKSSG